MLQADMLTRIHEGHLGMEKCNCRAGEILYWPQMSNVMEKTVKMCETCQQYQPKQKRRACAGIQ